MKTATHTPGPIVGRTIVVRKDNRIVGYWIPDEFKVRKQTISFYDESERTIEKILEDTEEWFLKKAAPGHELSIETIQIQSPLEASAPDLLKERDELASLSKSLLTAIEQNRFFQDGFTRGSASLSEFRAAGAAQYEAYSNLWDYLKAKGL